MDAKEFLDKKKTRKFTDITKGVVSGGAIGLAGGLLFAHFYQKSYWLSAVCGGIAAIVITKIFTAPKKN